MKSATVIYANISGEICISLEYVRGHKDSQNMWVDDGTVCDTNKVGNLSPVSPVLCSMTSLQ